jgi:hypothetical protein
LDLLFTFGTAISAGFFICGAFIAIDYVLFPKRTTATAHDSLP